MSSAAVTLSSTRLARRAPVRVLACGAWLKNTACLIEDDRVLWSPLHGDLGTPQAIEGLEASVEALLAQAGGPIDAVAHDLHPDFPSTHLAVAVAHQRGVPAFGVQHHHAHLAVMLAEQPLEGPVLGWALDGVGLGSDGTAWGGELLWVDEPAAAHRWRRLAHLPPLRLAGGDVAAREPWRLAAAALHAAGRADCIVPRCAPAVGEPSARMIATLLQRGVHTPLSTGAGRWFDAAAGLLGLSVVQREEAEAAIALERAARDWLGDHPGAFTPAVDGGLLDLVSGWADAPVPDELGRAAGAARFHRVLAGTLLHDLDAARAHHPVTQVLMGGGCFFNRVLTDLLDPALAARGLQALRPRSVNCGDAGLALGQAWVAACQLAHGASPRDRIEPLPHTID